MVLLSVPRQCKAVAYQLRPTPRTTCPSWRSSTGDVQPETVQMHPRVNEENLMRLCQLGGIVQFSIPIPTPFFLRPVMRCDASNKP